MVAFKNVEKIFRLIRGTTRGMDEHMMGNKMKEKGMRFEERVATMLSNRLEANIKRNVTLIDKRGNRSEIDIVYGIFFKTYVECKDYSVPVPLKDVAKFKEVLRLNNIGIGRGLFIASGDYVPRAKFVDIKLLDGDQLRRQEILAPFIGIIKFASYLSLTLSGYLFMIFG
ncbi:putative transmembrane protein [Cavenderia fasciculata]|uniref:Transmembrane protein n=1 Tax=Cavenderia fasciculata TaxID=261658 RepID=F4Q7I9_CACFS|nr:putative transmembrane protein [Cavenderia fasciculata]EGG16371.1 putative transmembrane protein [Cavenderia fasciculata]|eukprot:XP_004354755.1 putative transmembrane protein [Cavenderia fasciculata]